MRTMNSGDADIRARVLLACAAMIATGLGAAACNTDDLVDLQDPDLITLPTVEDTANAGTVRNGALFEFARAIAGPAANNETPGVVGIGGLLADELWYSSTFDTMKEIDGRSMQDTNSAVDSVYYRLHRARNMADEAEKLLAAASSDHPDRAQMKALSGYTFVFFAEDWCSHIPFSHAPLGQDIAYEPPIDRAAMLDSAAVRFQAAMDLGTAAGATDFVDLARLGMARVRQDQGDLAGAAALAQQIPADWAYEVEFSPNTSSQNNGIYYNINGEHRSSAASGDGVNGLVFFNRGTGTVSVSAPQPDPENVVDPRVQVDSAGVGGGTTVPLYSQYKYPGYGSNVPLATAVEAQLIIAEANLSGGGTAGSSVAGNWLAVLNGLRSGMDLPALSDPGNARDRVLMLYRERAFWLWLTGHRLGDLRRLLTISPYQGMFTADELFPIGTTIFNAAIGDDVAFPVPFAERNNPQYDPSGCDTAAP